MKEQAQQEKEPSQSSNHQSQSDLNNFSFQSAFNLNLNQTNIPSSLSNTQSHQNQNVQSSIQSINQRNSLLFDYTSNDHQLYPSESNQNHSRQPSNHSFFGNPSSPEPSMSCSSHVINSPTPLLHQHHHQRQPSNQSTIQSHLTHSSIKTTPTSPSSSNATRKTIVPSGRAKVNTLPPWAKSNEDDDELFESTSNQSTINHISSTNTFASQAESGTSSQQRNKKLLSRPSCSTTLVSDSPGFFRCNSPTFTDLSSELSITPKKLNRLKPKPFRIQSSTSPFKEKETFGNRESGKEDLERVEMSRMNTKRPCLLRSISQDDMFSPRTGIEPLNGRQNSLGAEGGGAGQTSRIHSGRLTSSIDISPVIQRFRSYGVTKKRKLTDELGPPESNETDPNQTNNLQSTGDDRWWQFTLTTKYRKKVESYIQRGGANIGGVSQWTSMTPTTPKQMVEVRNDQESSIGGGTGVDPNYTSHHAQTPGWNTPWQPFSRPSPHGIPFEDPFNDYRPHQGDFPLSAFSRKMSTTYIQPTSTNGLPTNTTSSGLYPIQEDHHRKRKIVYYLLNHPTAPLILRIFNFIFISVSLALCVKIRKVEDLLGLAGLIGNSTIYIIVIAPCSMLHILVSIYFEYFGAPIGIWSVSWKMFHTLSELVSISLWSAALALSFDNGLTSDLGCITGIGYHQFKQKDRHELIHVCELQAGLVCLIFLGLFSYSLVLVVSLFRIFNKVSRKA